MSPVPCLVPTSLGAPGTPYLLPREQARIAGLTDFVIEAEKTTRLHPKRLGVTVPIWKPNLRTLNEHTDLRTLPGLPRSLQEGRSMGTISEAGCSVVADPGANLAVLAHAHGFKVQLLMGLSNLLLMLMVSGANGQSFTLKGYLPSEKDGRIQALKALEQHSRKHDGAQIFIGTPYRNDVPLADAVGQLHPATWLCIACDLTLSTQTIISKAIAGWRKLKGVPDLKKRPTIFVLYAA